jgi:hypothetical protein
MSFAIAAGVGVALIGANASRSAAASAKDANQASIDAQEKATGDRLAFDKQVYGEGAADRQFASDQARQMAGWQTEDRTKYNALQDEQIARGRKFQTAEDGLLTDAENYDTEGKREQMAGAAMADVNQGFAAAKGQATRARQRMGVNPNSGMALSLDNQAAIAQAAGLAGAANGARLKAETTGYARKMDAVGLGKGVIGNQATQASLQLNSGNSAVTNSMLPINISNGANDRMSDGYGAAVSGYNNLANTKINGFAAATNYGNSVGSNVGNMFGNILSKPGVTSGISNWWGGTGADPYTEGVAAATGQGHG